MNGLPVDMSNIRVNVPMRAMTLLANGYPVQSVGVFDNSLNPVNIMGVPSIFE